MPMSSPLCSMRVTQPCAILARLVEEEVLYAGAKLESKASRFRVQQNRYISPILSPLPLHLEIIDIRPYYCNLLDVCSLAALSALTEREHLVQDPIPPPGSSTVIGKALNALNRSAHQSSANYALSF